MTQLNKVYILGKSYEITRMFDINPKFMVVDEGDNADIIVWPGGLDVNPELYGQRRIKGTDINNVTDLRDQAAWERYKDRGKLFVGICRGAQFLNVMNGGSMWQHVVNHRGGTHKAIDLLSGDDLTVTSTHHQMMRPTKEGEVLCIAHESTYYEDDSTRITLPKDGERDVKEGVPEFDTEVVWYPKTSSLCFQPHPEFTRVPLATKNYFFNLLNQVM